MESRVERSWDFFGWLVVFFIQHFSCWDMAGWKVEAEDRSVLWVPRRSAGFRVLSSPSPCDSVQRLSEVVVVCGSEDGVEAACVWLKPLQMALSKGRRCHSAAGDFWRFPLNSLLRADSLLLSILPGIFGLQGVRICSIRSLFASWSSLRGFGTV